jgi:2-oxoglutarate ferredoxin oxidoreductase subunit beta
VGQAGQGEGLGGVLGVGVFRDVYRPVYDDALQDAVTRSRAARGNGDLAKLLTSLGTWTVD